MAGTVCKLMMQQRALKQQVNLKLFDSSGLQLGHDWFIVLLIFLPWLDAGAGNYFASNRIFNFMLYPIV